MFSSNIIRSGVSLKVLALIGLAAAASACRSGGAEIDDYYMPAAHYERYPIKVKRVDGKTYAVTKECGTWDEDLTETSDNGPFPNFGCAQQHNIAALVSRPEDIERPRTERPSDPMRRSKVIDKYRLGDSTASAQEQQQQVQISTVAPK
ncbi:MAG: CpaD family pilus assembly lipoprotein [Parvibaculaceae bacterium]|jgi:pilus biogenesis lipoprotein CpaD